MFANIKARILKVNRDVWLVIALACIVIGILGGASYFSYWNQNHATETVTIYTKNGPVKKTYYGKQSSIDKRINHDQIIATAQMEGKTPKEVREELNEEGAAGRDAIEGFQTQEVFIAVVCLSVMLAIALPSSSDRQDFDGTNKKN